MGAREPTRGTLLGIDDVHVVALALHLGVPIWLNDSDFRGMPIEVYTTARLLKVLGL